jgi:uncharacterized phage protein (TIGR01671 family)
VLQIFIRINKNMRKIKLRCWNTNEKRWYFHGEEIWSLRPEITLVLNNTPKRENLVLMQWTGLKDKNGKEIYEGDLLIDNDLEAVRYKIVWYDDQAGFEIEALIDKEGNWDIVEPLDEFISGELSLPIFEIIGNIYENPELLTLENTDINQANDMVDGNGDMIEIKEE